MANVARLGVVMGLDTAEFSAGLQAAFAKLDDFKNKLLELGSLAAFGEMINKSMEFSDSIVKTAKANDVTTASVLELSKALEENGGSAEETGRLYAGFNQKVETAALGSAKAQESFARLGVSLNDLGHLSSQDLFEKTIAGLAKINDSVTRNGLAFQVLGRSIRGVDIVGLAQTLEETKGKMDQYAESVNQAHALHLQMEASSRQVTLAFTAAFIPSLDAVRKALGDTTKEGGGVVGMITDVINVLGVMFRYTTTTIVGLVDTFKVAGQMIKQSWDAIWSGSTAQLEKTYKDYNDKIKAMVEADAKFSENLINPTKSSSKPEDDPAVQRQIIEANAKKVDAAKGLTEQYKLQADLQYAMIEQQRQLLNLTKDQAVVQQAVNKVIDANQKAIDAIDKQISAAGQGSGAETLKRELEKQKAAILDLRDAEVARTKQGIQDTIDYQRTFSFGWSKAWAQYKEDAGNNAKITGDLFNSVMSSMNSALDTFVTTGKMNFSSFAQSVIQDIEKIILKAMVAKTMTAAFGGTAFGDLLGFADGGSPPVGVPSIVGEQGPELFVPNRSGTIIPNNQLSSVLGGGGTSGPTYNGPYIASMSAIDTQSAVQFLARNKTAVWSANQSAQRGLPTSR